MAIATWPCTSDSTCVEEKPDCEWAAGAPGRAHTGWTEGMARLGTDIHPLLYNQHVRAHLGLCCSSAHGDKVCARGCCNFCRASRCRGRCRGCRRLKQACGCCRGGVSRARQLPGYTTMHKPARRRAQASQHKVCSGNGVLHGLRVQRSQSARPRTVERAFRSFGSAIMLGPEPSTAGATVSFALWHVEQDMNPFVKPVIG